MRGTLLVLCALAALAVVVTSTLTSALHWQVDVSYGPTTVPMESTQTFSISLRNNGPDPVAVSRVAVTFDWVASGYAYVVSDQLFNLAPANDRTLTLTVDIPRLVQDSVHAVTILVTAETSGDLMAEQKEYNGEIMVTAAIPAATESLLFVGLGVLVAIVVVVLLVVYAVTRRRPHVPPPMAPPFVSASVASNCPTCGRPLTFVAQYQRWYCPSEGRYT